MGQKQIALISRIADFPSKVNDKNASCKFSEEISSKNSILVTDRSRLIEVLTLIKRQTQNEYRSITIHQRKIREKIYINSKFEKNLHNMGKIYISMIEQIILHQQKELCYLLRRIGYKTLQKLGYSDEEFADSLMFYQNDSEVSILVNEINKPKMITERKLLSLEDLLKIIKFQANVVNDICIIFKNYQGAKKKIIFNTVLSDITYFEYGCDKDDIDFAFTQSKITSINPIFSEFRELFCDINSVVNSI